MLGNTFNVFVILLFVFGINLVNISGHKSANWGLNFGDECTFNLTMKGICKSYFQCDYNSSITGLLTKEEIKKSLCIPSKSNSPFVCCPSTSLPPPSQLKMKFESKFDGATCKNREPQLEIGLNMESDQHAIPYEFQFQALIGYKSKKNQDSEHKNETVYFCGGALIAEDIVLTSAECLTSYNLTISIVKLGALSISNNPEDSSESEMIPVDSYKVHEQYSSINKINNIGIIKLMYPSTHSSKKTICLSKSDNDLPVNFTITGHGFDFKNKTIGSDWLLKETANICPHNKYKEHLEALNTNILDTQICVVGFNGANTCLGDSGGPLVFNLDFRTKGTLSYLYGIKSSGFECNSSLPSIYTRVNNYTDWIKDTISLLDEKSSSRGPIWN